MHIYVQNCYTYRIKWTKLNLSYYGVRYHKKSSPADLWKKYFTSSKSVQTIRQLHGDPDIIEIRKTFGVDIQSAINWELRVLKKLGIPKNIKWLNGHCGGNGYNAVEQCKKLLKNRAIAVIDGVYKSVSLEEFYDRNLSSNRKNKISVIDKSSKLKIDVTTEEFYKNRNNYIHQNEGKTREIQSLKNKANYLLDNIIVKLDTADAKRKGLSSTHKGLAPYKNKLGEIKLLSKSDPLVISGEYVGVNKGTSVGKGSKKPSIVCAIDNKKEYTLHNFNQHIRKIDKKLS